MSVSSSRDVRARVYGASAYTTDTVYLRYSGPAQIQVRTSSRRCASLSDSLAVSLGRLDHAFCTRIRVRECSTYGRQCIPHSASATFSFSRYRVVLGVSDARSAHSGTPPPESEQVSDVDECLVHS